MKKWTNNWTTPVRVLLAGAGIAAAAILVPMVVSAIAPSAGQVIGNQAAASYTDASGKPQTATSNQVSTTVAQIGGVTLSNTGDKTAAAGNTVYVPHTLTNTGNGVDTFTITAVDNVATKTFSNVAIYADPNGTGTPSGAPLCATPLVTGVPLCTAGFTQTVGGNSGTFNFVTAYTLPPTATTPVAPAVYDTGTVTATPVANAAIPYPATLPDATKTDTVRLTTGAAFASSKSIAKPAVAGPSAITLDGGWPAVVTSGKASASTCAATVAGVNAAAANCTYTVYTLSYNNTGGAAGSFYIEDALPTGMTYVPGTAVWSTNPGVALPDASALAATMPVSGINQAFDTTAKKFKADIGSVPVNTSGTISFVVMINDAAKAGTGQTNNVAAFSTTSCDTTCANGTPTTTPTNPSPFPVTSTYSVVAANASTVTTPDTSTPPAKPLATDTQATNPNLVDVPSAFLGAKVPFTDWIVNNGNVTDTFNVSLATLGTTNNNFPAGTTFAFFKADGVTPLLDTNGDGIPDTGPLAPSGTAGNSVAIVVVATLPTSAPAAVGPFDVLMTATSVGAGTTTPVIDSVWNQVDAIKSAKVDLTNTPGGNLASTDGGATTTACTAGSNCDLGQGPSTTPTFTTPTTPGTPAKFPIFITNEVPNTTTTYNLTASVPPGYTVKFVDNTSGTATCADTGITSKAVTAGATPTGPTNPAGSNEAKVLACVTPPAGTTPGTVPVTFTATNPADPTTTDTITDAVKVTQPIVPAIELGPKISTGTTPNGGTTDTPVTVTNTGTTSCGLNGGFNVSVTLDAASKAANWTATVYFDANKNGLIDPTDTVIDTSVATPNLTTAIAGSLVPLAPAPGNVLGLPLLVRLFAPNGATIGSTATATLTVTDMNNAPTTDAPLCPATSGQYSATVTNGQLSVVKTQVKVLGGTPSTATPPVIACAGNVDTATAAFDVASLSVKPGDCVVYKVVATNSGNAVVKKVVVSDAVPAYTSYNATQPTAQCAVTGAGTGSTAPSFAPGAATSATTAVSCGATTTDGVILNPQGTLTLYYAVQVQY